MKRKQIGEKTTLKEDIIFFLVALVVIPTIFFILVGTIKLFLKYS